MLTVRRPLGDLLLTRAPFDRRWGRRFVAACVTLSSGSG